MTKKNTERCTTEEIFQVVLVLKDVCEPLPADEWPDPDRKCFRVSSLRITFRDGTMWPTR